MSNVQYQGLGVSIGECEGKVRVVHTLSDLKFVEQNEILVTRETNPAYCIVLNKIAGIVTEMGGSNCHAAIIAREAQIPCVVAVKNASSLFKNGQSISIDGKEGIINIHG